MIFRIHNIWGGDSGRCGATKALRDDDDERRNRCLLCERPFKGSISQRSVYVYVFNNIYIYIIGVCVLCKRHSLYSCSENVYTNIIHCCIAANTSYYEQTAFDKTLYTIPPPRVTMCQLHRTSHDTPFHSSFDDVRFPALQTLTRKLTAPAAT